MGCKDSNLTEFHRFFGGMSCDAQSQIDAAVAGIVPAPPSTPTGFLWQIAPAGTTVVATWDVPPATVASTELWTSADDITYALAGTVAAPGVTVSHASPAVGAALYAKIRWVNAGGQSAFTASQVAWGQVADWASRVIVNGGAAVSQSKINNRNTFWGALVTAAIDSLEISIMTYCADNLIAAITPLKVGGGNDPWTNSNFVLADLSADGLKGDGATKGLLPGFNLATLFPDDTKLGYSVYSPQTASAVTNGVIGISNTPFTNNGSLLVCQSGQSYFECWNVTGAQGSGFLTVVETFSGFYSGNRTAANAMAFYHANSVTPFAAVDTGTGTSGTRPNGSIQAHGVNVLGTGIQLSPLRLSYLSIHQGFTLAQAQAEYNAVQALRVADGGGFV